jgi:hypothetical protein
MALIADTAFGRNALVCGLVIHFAACIVAMTTTSGADVFFMIVYPFSCLALVSGAYAELKHRGCLPSGTSRYYLIVAVAVFFPVIGPLVILGCLYRTPKCGQDEPIKMLGLIPAILHLKANLLLVFVLIISLFLLLAIVTSRNDAYFKKRAPMSLLPQSALWSLGKTIIFRRE